MRLVNKASIYSHGVAVRPEICSAMAVIDTLHILEAGRDAEFTSICDGKHSAKHSLHYNGLAVDLRIWYVDGFEFSNHIQDSLGPMYQVRLESDHIHIEYQPTREG